MLHCLMNLLILLYYSKPKNQRAKRALEKREPKIVENDKIAMFIKGGRTSEIITQVLKDLVCDSAAHILRIFTCVPN